MRSKGWGPDIIGLVPLLKKKKKEETSEISLSASAEGRPHEDMVRRCGKVAIYKPGRAFLPEIKFAGT